MELIENLGIIVAAFSGSFIGIQKKLDLFGVILIAMVTSVGGGFIRDIILGNTPPMFFRNPKFALLSIFSSIIAVCLYNSKFVNKYTHSAILILDAIVLGVFTLVGSNYSINLGFGDNIFLTVFVGVCTGVGGGVLRDVLINRTPIILRREIYAVPAIIGALIYVYINPYMIDSYSLWICASIIATIRIIAVRRDLHMPRIKRKEKK